MRNYLCLLLGAVLGVVLVIGANEHYATAQDLNAIPRDHQDKQLPVIKKQQLDTNELRDQRQVPVLPSTGTTVSGITRTNKTFSQTATTSSTDPSPSSAAMTTLPSSTISTATPTPTASATDTNNAALATNGDGTKLAFVVGVVAVLMTL